MTAPALVALATGTTTPATVTTSKALRAEVHGLRPDLRTELAYLAGHRPTLTAAVDRLVSEGYDEVVVVPLRLSEDGQDSADLQSAITAAGAGHDGVLVRATPPLGLEPGLLNVLDQRMRAALRRSGVRELDALVLTAPGSADVRRNQAVTRLARLWGNTHHLPTRTAFAATAPPSPGEAVRGFRAEGRRHVAVGSLFLTPGRLVDRATELAREAGAVTVCEPLGADPEVARRVLARYAVGAVELVPV